MAEKGSGRKAIEGFIREAERREPGISPDTIVTFLASAEDKAMVYEIKGLPIPPDLTDDPATGLSFVRTRTPGDA